MDSLRYWVTEMHVDGFRFDLASTLAREFYDVDRLSTFFELVQQDPVVSQVKLIAEPWDIGPGGYQVGGFPPQWTEWNGEYRDTVRDFWRGEPSLGEFASRLAGSSDLYEHSGRRPFASINFVTAHDGFTLRDLVSYDEKHNEANGEDNNDGESHNRSWNHGVEGPTDDPEILGAPRPRAAQPHRHAAAQPGRADDPARRRARPHPARQQQHLRPGLRAQLGALGRRRPAAGRVHRRRRPAAPRPPDVPAQAVLHRQRRCAPAGGDGTGSTTSSGCTSTATRWRTTTGHGRATRRSGCTSTATASPARTSRGETILDDHFLLYFNADGPVDLTLPPEEYADAWDVVIDTGGSADDDATGSRRAAPSTSSTAAWWCCASTPSPRCEPDLSVAASVAAQATVGIAPRDLRVPASTYRLQITPDVRPVRGRRRSCPTCTTSASTGSTCRRCSRPSPGSTHGYDVVAFDRVDPARGGAEGLAALSAEARRLGMGVLVDIVPNHVGVATPSANAWWWDVLRARPRVGVRGVLRHRLGRRRRPRCGPATTSTTAASSPSTRWPASASRTPRSSRRRTSRSGAGSTRASSTGCGSTTRRPARPGRLPRRPGRADRRRLRRWSRRSSSPARRCRRPGRPRAPPGTTPSRSSTACSPTRPARSR